MSRIYPLDIPLEDVTEETIDQIAAEIEEVIKNFRMFYNKAITRQMDVDIDEQLAKLGAAALIWTSEEVRKIVPHLNDDQALAVIRHCFRIISPRDTVNPDMVFEAAERLYPTLSRDQRCRRVDKAIYNYANGDARENLVDLLADAMHWCDDLGEPFEDFCATARVHYAAERNPQQGD